MSGSADAHRRMRAVEISEPGSPDVLKLVERACPIPQAGEVLIEVAAAGVNRPDVLQRLGKYPVPNGASDLPGLEVAGVVVGGESPSLPIGSRVCALVQGGGYAEYCVAPVEQCLPVPNGLSLVEAACLPETFFTVWSNVFERARLGLREDGEPETLLVQGGSSGIGTTAIQLAHALGHRVFATAGSADKVRACEALGAERGIDYRREDFVEVVRATTNGRGVDVILDMVAGDYLAREVDLLAEDGRLVVIATLGGAHATIDMRKVLSRRLTITASTLRPRSIAFKARIARALRERVWPLIEAGAVKPVIHRRFPLRNAADAHRTMESSSHIGKLVLVMRDDAEVAP